jgi:hypothetical protein
LREMFTVWIVPSSRTTSSSHVPLLRALVDMTTMYWPPVKWKSLLSSALPVQSASSKLPRIPFGSGRKSGRRH